MYAEKRARVAAIVDADGDARKTGVLLHDRLSCFSLRILKPIYARIFCSTPHIHFRFVLCSREFTNF